METRGAKVQPGIAHPSLPHVEGRTHVVRCEWQAREKALQQVGIAGIFISVATVTNYQKVGGLKQEKVILSQFRG